MIHFFLAAGYLVSAIAAAGEFSVTLSPAPQAGPLTPYRLADVRLADAPPQTRTLLFRPQAGPDLRVALGVSSAGTGPLSVPLPALGRVQPYQILALDADGKTLARSATTISWPIEQVNPDAYVDPALARLTALPATWPLSDRTAALGLMAIFLALAGATLLISRASARLAAVAVLAVAGLAGGTLAHRPAAVRFTDYRLDRAAPGDERTARDAFTSVAALRTGIARLPTKVLAYPVCSDPKALEQLAAQVNVSPGSASSIDFDLSAGEVAIAKDTAAPAPAAGHGQIVLGTQRALVTSDAPHLHAYLIHDGAFWPILPGVGPLQVRLSLGTGLPLWQLPAAGPTARMHPNQALLLNYWRDKYLDDQAWYLVNLPQEGRADLDVLQLDVRAETTAQQPQ